MTLRFLVTVLLIQICFGGTLSAQVTDSNTPLHLIPPDYPHPYGKVSVNDIKADMDKILKYLEKVTPAEVVDKKTGKKLRNADPGNSAAFAKGDYRLFSYEWGVTYGGMLAMTQAVGDKNYSSYAEKRIDLLSTLTSYYQKKSSEVQLESPVKSLLHPHALDDAGALCVAMIKLQLEKPNYNFRPVIDHLIEFIVYKEYRLADGTFARKRPLHNTVWLDDMFMSVPAIAYMGKLTGDTKYFDQATEQIFLFSEKMFDNKKNIFIHGWIEASPVQPKYHWGRANGWAIMAITEVLNVLPENHKNRKKLLDLYYNHVQGLAALQSGSGLWHQLLDKSDSYLETSATAIFTYSIVNGINKGWLDYEAFGPMVLLAWEALSTKIDAEGKVHGTCVGTGMGFDPAFYYYRPVNPYAAHSYGPMLLAGAEMIKLLTQRKYGINETAVQFLQD
jgi:unsaturated rhamnogalacturonyl hydrolase